MSPEALLSLLVQAGAQLPDATDDTPFLLQTNPRGISSLMHPKLPDGGLVITADMRTAIRTLVQWGYLAEPAQYQGVGYVVTLAGRNYVTPPGPSPYTDGERRRSDRRGRDRRQVQVPVEVDRRQGDRRTGNRRTI